MEIKIGQKFKREWATAKQARILAKNKEKKHWFKRQVTMARQQLNARIWLRTNITQSCDCLFKASPWENSCLQWVFSQLGSKIITAFFLSIQHFNATHLLLDKRKRKYEVFFFVSLVCLKQSFTYGKAFHVSCWTSNMLFCSSCQWKLLIHFQCLSQVSEETGSSVWFRDVLFVWVFGGWEKRSCTPELHLLRLWHKTANGVWELTAVELSLGMKWK